MAYLHDREMIYGVYRPWQLPVTLLSWPRAGKRVQARTYVVDRRHPQYAGDLSLEQRAAIVTGGVGSAGRGRDYLANTVDHLIEMGMPDRNLEVLHRMVQDMRAGRRPIPAFPLPPPDLDQRSTPGAAR